MSDSEFAAVLKYVKVGEKFKFNDKTWVKVAENKVQEIKARQGLQQTPKPSTVSTGEAPKDTGVFDSKHDYRNSGNQYSHKAGRSQPSFNIDESATIDVGQSGNARHAKTYHKDLSQRSNYVADRTSDEQAAHAARGQGEATRSADRHGAIHASQGPENRLATSAPDRHSVSNKGSQTRPAESSIRRDSFADTGRSSLSSTRSERGDLSSQSPPPNEAAIDGDEFEDEADTGFKFLDGIARLFAEIREDNFRERASFLADNKDLLDSKLDKFLREAVSQILKNDLIAARQCIQSLVILNLCRGHKHQRLASRVLSMQDEHNEVCAQYRQMLTDVAKQVQNLANSKQNRPSTHTPQPSELRETSTRTSAAASRAQSSRYSGVISPITRIPSINSLSIDDMEPGNHDDPELDKISKVADRTTLKSKEVKPDDFEDAKMRKAMMELSSSYRIQQSPWFKPGRVFALLWHESASTSQSKRKSVDLEEPTQGDSYGKNMTKGPYGEWIFSHIRRMVVIKNRTGHCWCLPIGSYGGKGLLKPGLKPEHIEAHSIIYDSSKRPTPLIEEPEMTKPPIAVNMVQGQKLSPASRLHFGKPCSVEHNTVKVMNVGMVRGQDMPELISWAKYELFGEP